MGAGPLVPWWSLSEGGPHAHAAGASLAPKRRRPHHTRGPPLCGDGGKGCTHLHTLPRGVPIPQNALHQTGGARVY